MPQSRGRNPFRPGDPVPDPFVGRLALRESFAADVLARMDDAGAAPPLIILGLSGVGKTACLNILRQVAEDAGWLAPMRQKAEKDLGLRTMMGRVFADAETDLGRMDISKKAREALATLTEVRIQLGFASNSIGITAKRTAQADDASLGQVLYELFERLAKASGDIPIAIFLDEIQLLHNDTLRALMFAVEHTMSARLPIAFVAAGLPHTRAALGTAGQYTRRFNYKEIGDFTADETILALRKTAQTVKGQDFTEEAGRLCHRLTGGYPQFVQTFGYIAWNIGHDTPISAADIKRVESVVWDDLSASFFRPRWADHSQNEQAVLMAMAEMGDNPHSSGDIAEYLKRQPQQIAPYLMRMLDAGSLIQPQERGPYEIALPRFGGYIRSLPKDQ